MRGRGSHTNEGESNGSPSKFFRNPAPEPRRRDVATLREAHGVKRTKQRIALFVLLGLVLVASLYLLRTPYDPIVHRSYAGANIILIGIDTLRPDHTSLFAYNRDTTPHLKEFAKQCYVFKNCQSVAPWTVPSFMSIFTGLYPTLHGVTNKLTVAGGKIQEMHLSRSVITLPQLLRKQGYLLAGFTGDAGVSARFGFGRQFDTFLDNLTFAGMDYSAPKALEWLRHRPQDKPFFLFLHGYDVHGQYDPPKGYTRRYMPDYKGPLRGDKTEQARLREQGLRNATRPASLGEAHLFNFSPQDAAFYAALYDEKINDMDVRLNDFLDQIKQMGLLDNSLVMIVSDHGDEFMEHGAIDHGQSLYDELTHVLLMIHFPHQTVGSVIEQKVNSFDGLPTVLDAAGVAIPHQISAVSLMPLLRGARFDLPNLYAETDYRYFMHKRSIQNDRYKFILNLVSGKRELYDLKQDSGEQHNVVDSNPRVAYEMEQDLLRWLNGMKTPVESYRGRQEKFHPGF